MSTVSSPSRPAGREARGSASPLVGWRLPLRLAWRDLLRYKGRSALAALLILLPVGGMAATLTFGPTASVSDDETRAARFENARAHASFWGVNPGDKPIAFPAAKRVVSSENPPTAAEVSRQAGGVPVTPEETSSVMLAPASGGAPFTAVDGQYYGADLHSPLIGDTVTIASGRLPRAAGEIVVTDLGRNRGMPDHGVIQLGGYRSTPTMTKVTIVGVVHSRLPYIYAAGPIITEVAGEPSGFVIGGSTPFTRERISEWARYGASVESRDYVSPELPKDDLGDRTATIIGTMAFVCVTAMLAAPAFAAGATRHRRTLGLIASNGGTHATLRRVVFAQAMLLGALTAVVAAVVGGIIGVFAGRWYAMRETGVVAPVDVRVSWLAALVVVATVASLVAAFVPARSAGRTNLLAALRGQVSSRTVKKRWPTLGLALIAAAALLLLAAITLAERDESEGLVSLLIVVGMPLLFAGAVLAVPYLLMLTGFLAGHLPLTARLAVRDVSRQRTRATASIGAILATVAVFSGGAVAASSYDAYDAAMYAPTRPIGTGSFDLATPSTTLSDAEVASAVASIRKISGAAMPHWEQPSSDHLRTLGLPGQCSKGRSVSFSPSVTAVDSADLGAMGLDAQQRTTLENGGVLVVDVPPAGRPSNFSDAGPGTSLRTSSITNGRLTVPTMETMETKGSNPDGSTAITSCKDVTVPATAISAETAEAHANAYPTSVIMTRATAGKLGLPLTFAGITVAPRGGIDATTESQLQAAAPLEMRLTVEHARTSPLEKVLALVTLAFAVIILVTTVVATLLSDAESQGDAATLATVGAPTGMRRRIVGAQAFVLGFLGAGVGIVVGIVPGLMLAREATRPLQPVGPGPWSERMTHRAATYVIPWWQLAVMLVVVPLLAALVSMVFARRNPSLTRRER